MRFWISLLSLVDVLTSDTYAHSTLRSPVVPHRETSARSRATIRHVPLDDRVQAGVHRTTGMSQAQADVYLPNILLLDVGFLMPLFE